MDLQQSYQAYAQNKGTLATGQFITLNEHTVQVERYLSQGGFAHVYLVRTAKPVFNTTHHVLKRIAVSNEAALTEVKKEVDIMRFLKGHPNIVHLIDAASHRMTTGAYEVFILMEYCPGGGIIDMMNRRLRERLTEAEIFQIFVDVCEGVAAMHNLRPPLLHRDLKVENILQSTPNSYKLCDFGSATPVAPRPPATTQEIRMVEADLNRHTTLQYRAPEMVDPYLRRPIDEKSDVWALGVLLYKLCYYTTPFEEHGPLAILNVNYRFPLYPVYSSQMNGMIASMLMEHGAQRPHVFEILASVHRLRGTKSRYNYTIPLPTPLSPLSLQMPSPPSTAGSAGSLITPPSTTARRPSTGDPGNQARAKGAGSVSPMYKANTPGLAAPNLAMRSSTSSPGMATGVVQVTDWLEGPVSQGQQGTKTNTPESLGHRMPLPGPMSGSPDTRKAKAAPLGGPDGDAWSIRGKENKSSKDSPAKAKASPPGFGDHFAPQKPWDSGINLSSVSAGGSPGRPVSLVARPPASKAGELPRNNWSPPGTKAKDVFDGLGLSLPERMPAPTLGEARKLRTGLAVVHGRNLGPPAPSDRSNSPGSAATMLMPSSSASQSPSLRPGSSSSRTIQTTSKLGISQDHLPAEARFPSLEELDATFAPPIGGLPPPLQAHTANSSPGIAPSLDKLSSSPSIGNNHTVGLRPLPIPPVGVRSAKVTGVAMRDSFDSSKPLVDILVVPSTSTESETHSPKTSRPSLSRRHRSSISVKHAAQPSVAPLAEASHPPQAGDNSQNSSFLPQRMNVPPIKTEGESPSVTYTAYLRDSPGKRVAHEQSRMTHSPQEATRVLPHSLHSTDSSRGTRADVATSKPSRVPPLLDKVSTAGLNHSTHEWSTAKWSPSQHESGGGESSSSVDEGPEDPHGYVPASKLTKRQGKKGRQSSVHDLVDLWGGAAKDREKEMTRHVTPTDDSVKLPVPTSLPKPHPSPVFPRSSSPQKLPAVDSSPRQAKQSPKRTHHRRDSKGSGLPSASPVRSSRPQSMFLFPMSKSLSDDRSPDTSASVLAPPAELKPRASRRTSITDMVQHYEAIDGKAKGAPAIATSSATLASTSAIVPVRENGRHSRIRVPSSPITSRVDALSRLSPSAPEKDASGLAKRRTSPTGLPNTIRPKELEHGSNLGPPTSPYRITTIENPTPGPAQPSPVRKSTEERPPSPDKPYQGVGKLINQWEGKTAEADPSRAQPRRRGGFVPKRTQPTGE